MQNYIIRGILIGGSIGVFAALFGFMDNMFFACGEGMIVGALAGLTLRLRAKKKAISPAH